MHNTMLSLFETIFEDTQDVKVFFAPGRVNLIGEHTDYNGGHVFPCALTIGTYAAVRLRQDSIIRFYSENFIDEGVITIDLKKLDEVKKGKWISYAVGVIQILKKRGIELPFGFDVVYYGNIPNSSGLSSSASLEVLTGYFISKLYEKPVSMIDLAKISQQAENDYIGVACGIMDQFAIAMGKEDNAIFLDTNTLTYQYVPIAMKGVTIVVSCSNKKRGLKDSKYNERRRQCEEALADLQTIADITSLGDLSIQEFEQYKSVIKDEINIKRARHAVYENQRTIMAIEALEKNDLNLFGEYMRQSHESLRDDYEVTGVELDTLYDAAKDLKGVIGTRMTGAGFGGCSVSLVKDEDVENFIKEVGRIYEDKIGYQASFYPVKIGDGPKML